MQNHPHMPLHIFKEKKKTNKTEQYMCLAILAMLKQQREGVKRCVFGLVGFLMSMQN